MYISKAQQWKRIDVAGAKDLIVCIYVHACVCTCV